MWNVLKFICTYLKSYKLLTFMFLLLFGLDLIFVSIAPLSFNYIIDYAVTPRDVSMFTTIVVILLGIGIVCTIAGVFADRLLSKLNALVEQDMRQGIFSKLQQLTIRHFQAKRTGEHVALFSSDIPTISSTMTSLLSTGIQSVVVVVISMGVLLYLEWSMALLIIAGASLIFVGPMLLSRRAKESYEDYKAQAAQLNSEISENVKAQKLIKSYNLQQTMQRRFLERTKLLFVSSYKVNRVNAALGKIPMISLLVVNLSIMVFGSYLAIVNRISIGELIAFYTMYMSMGNSVYNLTFIIPSLTDAKVSVERLSNVLNGSNELDTAIEGAAASELGAASALDHSSKPNASKLGKHAEAHDKPAFAEAGTLKEQRMMQPLQLEFNDVSFGYERDRRVLHHIQLTVPFGATVAFVGSSGSGKSSMVQLLLGLYEPDEGELLINGMRLDKHNLATYRDRLAVVFQDNFMFQGTIKENIAISKQHATDEEIIRAAQLAEIHDYIMTLPLGYETAVHDEGSNFSGGQRQRLAIARALVRDPQLLILDEATSALDPATEAAMNETIKKLAKQRTVVSVTHRLSTVADADLICVFNQGQLIEQGRHDELLALQGQYQFLWEKQAGFTFSDESDDVQIDAARLSKLTFFKPIAYELLEDIAMLFNTERYEQGATIIQEGERGEKFYIVIRGKVEVLKRVMDDEGHVKDKPVAVLEDGDHFGEIALLQHVPRTATIKALTSCVVISLQRKHLQHILSRHPEINHYVHSILAERLS